MDTSRKTHAARSRSHVSASLRAQRSDRSLNRKKEWIASSQGLLAMTTARVPITRPAALCRLRREGTGPIYSSHKIILDGTRRPRSESMKQVAASDGWSLSVLSNGAIFMRMTSLAAGLLSLLAAGPAMAQSVNLTGPYRCVADCRDGMIGAPA